MAENVIAIILSEYEDNANTNTANDWKSKFILEDEEMGKYIKELAEFVDFLSDENCKIIYDSKNISAFTFVLRTMPECYPSREAQLRSIMKKASNWRSNRESKESDEYFIDYVKLKDEIRCELTARRIKDNMHSCLIVAHIPNFKNRWWHISTGEQTYDLYSCKLDIVEVFNWVSKNHKPMRKYSWNPKHGENGYGAYKTSAGEYVSVLMCSKEHAAELLQTAIGLRSWNVLYNFDPVHKKYMEYKAECKFEHLQGEVEERKYHSYHLNSGELIPKRIEKKLRLLGVVTD